MRTWTDLVPVCIARMQHGFERKRAAAGMRKVGMTYKAIGGRLNIGPERARQLILSYQRRWGDGQRCPVEIYLERGDPTENEKLRQWHRNKS